MFSLVAGFIGAFLLASLPGAAVIERLKRLGARQNISADAPGSHSAKQGTPTMGGVLILFSLTVTVLVYFGMTQLGEHRQADQDFALLALLLLTLAFGAIGFTDDYLSAKRGKNLGLRARDKFAAQCFVAALFLLWMIKTAQPGLTTMVNLAPSVRGLSAVVDLGWWYYVLAGVLIVGLSNATNFTDGLDGLCSGICIIVSLTLASLVMRGMGGAPEIYTSLGYYAVVLAGAMAGFLWWNACPAKVFMGDTASLAIGAALAGIALMGKKEVGLLVASLVCWAELVSVMIQVTVFKWRKKTRGIEYARAHRVFRRTPLHHHFEEGGWPETRVVTRFWLAAAACCAAALLWKD